MPKYKYGDKPTRQYVVEAIRSLGGAATLQQIERHMEETRPDIKSKNIDPDLRLLTVNAFGRANWPSNRIPRTVDGSHPNDVLFLETGPEGSRYAFFDPVKHGVWELAAVVGEVKLRPRRIKEPRTVELEACRAALEKSGGFDPTDEADARRRVDAAIVRRQGQSAFRNALLRAYAGRCAFTTCDVTDVLEAAHVRPYLGAHTNVVTNGLLLRADVHTLFDLGLLRVWPETFTVHVADQLRGSEYDALSERRVLVPEDPVDRPSAAALRMHWECNAHHYSK